MEGKIKSGKRLIVIGGGAAGFFCAVNAARLNPSLRVTIIEKSNKILSKVKVSGGGRCNLTHACFDIDQMVRKYPRGGRFLKSAFHHFFTTDTIKWFEERGVKCKAESDGRMFPVSDSSQTIIDCLLKEANTYKVEVLMNREVKDINKLEKGYQVLLNNGESIDTSFVCIACGGYPKTAMFDWIKHLGHTIESPVPSLFTFNIPTNSITSLMGVVVEDVKIKIVGSKLQETGPLLITHWGMSGPAVLKLSAWGARELADTSWQFKIVVNWLGTHNEQSLKTQFQEWRNTRSANRLWAKNELGLPNRFWEFKLQATGISENLRWADLPGKQQQLLINQLCADQYEVKGKTTFKEEFVTAGGVRLSEVDPSTMMSKILKGVFFAGEMLDVDGITGGFNFQHAWTSGFIAGKTVAKMSEEL